MSDAPDADGPTDPAHSVGDDEGTDGPLSAAERARLEALAAAESLADLVDLTGADSEHDAYLEAKAEWRRLCRRCQRHAAGDGEGDATAGLPGERVRVDDVVYHVHGVTHAGTETERSYLRERVNAMLDAGGVVYVEQGLRQLYFADLGVCEMDDYRWALARCRDLDVAEMERFEESSALPDDERIDGLSERLRERTYALIDAYSSVYGETVERALGDLASAVLTDHEGLATGDEYEAFALRRAAVADPAKLPALQAYYRRSFLPQPVEREWVRRHDPDLELVTHARNARMADYAVHHADDAPAVHVLCGAAHGPGVAYYLREHRDGERSTAGFELA